MRDGRGPWQAAAAGAALAATSCAAAAGGAMDFPRLALLAVAFVPAAVFHVGLTFPSPLPLARQTRALVPAGYALCAVPAVLGLQAVPRSPALAEAVCGLSSALAGIVGVPVLVRLCLCLRSAGEERRIAAVALGGAALAVAALSERLAGGASLSGSLVAALAFPGAIGVALATRSRRDRAPDTLPSDRDSLSLATVARGMAHTIVKPVSVVAERLHGLAQEASDPELREELDDAAQLMQQVRRLVRDVLDLTRAQGGPARRSVSLAQLAAQAIRDVRARFGNGNITLASFDTRLVADEVAIRCLLVNLLENALEAAGGTGCVRIDVDRRGPFIDIVVSDDAGGIRPALRERIFDPFESTKPHGTGLGLTIAREICRAHGGDLVLEPVEGGSRFVARLAGERLR